MPSPVTVFRGHHDAINTVVFLSDDIITSGSADGSMIGWSVKSKRSAFITNAHDESILSISSLAQLQKFVTSSRDRTVKVWDVETIGDKTTAAITLNTGARHFCNSGCNREPTESQTMICTPSEDESAVLLWDIRSKKSMCTLKCSEEHGMTSSLCLYKNDLYVGLEDGVMCIFDVRLQRLSRTVDLCVDVAKSPVMAIDVFNKRPGKVHEHGVIIDNECARFVVAGAADKYLRCVDISSSSTTASLVDSRSMVRRAPPSIFSADLDEAEVASTPGTGGVSFRSDGRVIGSAHWDGSLKLWDSKRMKNLASLRHHRDSVYSVAFGPRSCGLFATGSKDCTVALWDLYADTMREKDALIDV